METVVALGLFLILSISVTNLLLISSNRSGELMIRQELLENARISIDFMTANIAMAEEITLKKRTNGTLSSLRLTETDSSGLLHTYVYQYDSTLIEGHVRYHRLELGGNELASFIASIRVEIDTNQEILTVFIKTDDRLETDGKTVEPIELTKKVKIKYKKVTVHV